MDENLSVQIETICEHADGQSFVMLAQAGGARYMLRTTTSGTPDYVSRVDGIVVVRHSTASMRKLVVQADEIGQHAPEVDPVCAALLKSGHPLSALRFYVRRLYPNPDFIRGILPPHAFEDSIAVRLSAIKKQSPATRAPRVTQVIVPTRPDTDRPPSWLITHQAIAREPLAIEIALPDAYANPDDFAELLLRLTQLKPP